MGKLALIFPGQGSQSVGMGRELAGSFEAAAAIYKEANDILDWDVAGLSFEGPADMLGRTEYAQVALYVNSMAAMAVLSEKGVRGDVVSGHSLGEYSALAAAGALNFEAALKLVSLRGEIMGRLAKERPGSMAAIIGLKDGEVESICAESGEVWPANYNCPGQLVISGETEAVHRAMTRSADAGAKRAVMLTVSGPFHSPLMRNASGEMRVHLTGAEFKEADPPFLSSISCEYEAADGLAGVLAEQITSAVKWRLAVEKLIEDGCDRFFEVGNGKTLCGLIKRIDRGVRAVSVSDPDSLDKALASL
ncbi:MAG: ACP S-malonyltransferase [Actinomycetota bacterium]